MYEITDNDKTYTTEAGFVVELGPIAIYEIDLIRDGTKKKHIDAGKQIEPPTYEAETVGGGKLRHSLSKDNLIVEGNDEETKRRQDAWKKHEDDVSEMQNEIGRLITDLFLDGVTNVTEVPKEWIEKKKKRNISLPNNDSELLSLYKRIEIAKTYNDITEIRERVTRLSLPHLPQKAAVDAAAKSFPGDVSPEPE